MLKKIIKISFYGLPGGEKLDKNNLLILRIIEAMSNSTIEIVKEKHSSDMILVYPYGGGSKLFKLKWFIFFIFKKIFKTQDCTSGLRWIFGVGTKPILFISHENLDRPYWWRIYGSLIIHSKIPRLTYWPNSIDSGGARFPYWFNYVDWPDYPRQNFYSRFGKLYSIDSLMKPLKEDHRRKDAAILIASHLDYPRVAILDKLNHGKFIEIYGRSGTLFKGGKYFLMNNYKYAFCCENSIGFGYDSEKIPEAWIAGCIPYGVFLNPYSDFNPDVLHGSPSNPITQAFSKPLLLKKPNLIEIEEYVKNFIKQYGLGNADLSRGNSIS